MLADKEKLLLKCWTWKEKNTLFLIFKINLYLNKNMLRNKQDFLSFF